MRNLKTTRVSLLLLFILYTPVFCFAAEESAFFRGFNYLRNKQYTRAIRQFELTIKRDPTYLPTYSYLGECYERQKKYDESKEVWKKYVEHAKFYKEAGKKHIELLDKIKEAKSILTDVLRQDVVRDTGIMQELAIADTSEEVIDEKKAWEMAEPLLIDVANDQYPMSIICLQAREILGKYYFKNKLYKEAADAYKKVLRFYPRDITQEILYNYAISLGHIKEYEDSVNMFVQIAKNCPITGIEEKKEFREYVVVSYLGMANEIAGTEETEDMLKAIEMYQKIEQYYSDTKVYDVARKNMRQVEKVLAKRFKKEADEAYVEKDYSRAIEYYQKMLINCCNLSNYNNYAQKMVAQLNEMEYNLKMRGFRYYCQEEYEKCRKIYKETIEMFPEGKYAAFMQKYVGYSYAAEKKYREAIAQLYKVYKIYPESSQADDALERLGVMVWKALNKPDVALKVFAILAKKYQNTNNADDALYYIGVINLEQKNYKQAYLSFQRLIKKYPESQLTVRSKIQMKRVAYEAKKHSNLEKTKE